MGKIKSSKSGLKVPAGGSNVMLQGQATGPQKPGVSSQEQSRSKDKGFAKGGSTPMFGKQTSKPLTPA